MSAVITYAPGVQKLTRGQESALRRDLDALFPDGSHLFVEERDCPETDNDWVYWGTLVAPGETLLTVEFSVDVIVDAGYSRWSGEWETGDPTYSVRLEIL